MNFFEKFDAWDPDRWNPYYWDCEVANEVATRTKSKEDRPPLWVIPPKFIRDTLMTRSLEYIGLVQPQLLNVITIWPTTDICIMQNGDVLFYDEENEMDMLFCVGAKKLSVIFVLEKDTFYKVSQALTNKKFRVKCIISDDTPPVNQPDLTKFDVKDYRFK